MWKACGRCGKIHDNRHICYINRVYQGGKERELRNTYAWQCKAREVKEKANYLCEVCKYNGVYTYEGLEVHHIVKLLDNPSGLLDDYNLSCLCVEHHKQADKNLIDSDYLRKLAEAREGK